MNTQPIEKRLEHDGSTLDVHSIFHTIQGEGPFVGTPCVFIRLAGCNLQCPGCDTEYTSGRKMMTVTDIAASVLQYQSAGLVVITGGEPFRQNLLDLLERLSILRFYIQIETNGTLRPTESIRYSKDLTNRKGVYIVCSPKSGKVNPTLEANAVCFKYVLSHDSVSEHDGLPLQVLEHTAEPQVARPTMAIPIYVQPMDTKGDLENELNLRAAKSSALKFGHMLGVQMHKIIGVD